MTTSVAPKGQSLIYAADISWQTVDAGVQRKVLGHDDAVMMVLVKFEKDAVGQLHHHPHRQVSYVASGSFEVTIDGESKTLGAGDCYFVAPDLVHGVKALSDGVLVDVFTPCRQDFLPS